MCNTKLWREDFEQFNRLPLALPEGRRLTATEFEYLLVCNGVHTTGKLTFAECMELPHEILKSDDNPLEFFLRVIREQAQYEPSV